MRPIDPCAYDAWKCTDPAAEAHGEHVLTEYCDECDEPFDCAHEWDADECGRFLAPLHSKCENCR